MQALALGARRPAGVSVSARQRAVAGVALVTAAAAALRLGFAFGSIAPNPFYDAAVRSMSQSWHNFFFGAFEPGGSVSVDKAPVDLWLQVASVKLLGLSSASLRLPEALAGTAAVPLLYALVTRLAGRAAGLVAAAALAVLPVAVLTARSDTMDSLMMALLVLAALLAVRAGARNRTPWGAAAVLGLAFNVKLFEALVPLPAIGALYLLAAPGPLAPRLRRLALAGGAFVAVALAWVTAAGLTPLGARPYPIGSSNGGVWNVVFGFDGIDRLGAARAAAGPAADPPGPLRLLGAGGNHYGALIGLELLPALVLGALAARRRQARRALAGVGLWLVLGALVLSLMGQLHPRYLEAVTPAVAGVLGIAVATLARGRARLVAVTALLLALPLVAALHVARAGSSDSGRPGYMPSAQTARLSRYLQAHTRGAHFELASSTANKVGPLIVRDGRPVMILTTPYGRQLTPPATLARAVAAGRVRYALLAKSSCPTCIPSIRWAIRHGTDVSRSAGLPTGSLLRLS